MFFTIASLIKKFAKNLEQGIIKILIKIFIFKKIKNTKSKPYTRDLFGRD